MNSDDAVRAFMREVGGRLRDARESKGETLESAARRIGKKTKATVGHWEKGINPIGLDNLFRLARFYETSVAALIPGGDSITEAITALERIRADAKTADRAAEQPTAAQDAKGRGSYFRGAKSPIEAAPPPAPAPAPRARKRSDETQPKRGAPRGR